MDDRTTISTPMSDDSDFDDNKINSSKGNDAVGDNPNDPLAAGNNLQKNGIGSTDADSDGAVYSPDDDQSDIDEVPQAINPDTIPGSEEEGDLPFVRGIEEEDENGTDETERDDYS